MSMPLIVSSVAAVITPAVVHEYEPPTVKLAPVTSRPEDASIFPVKVF